MGFSSRDDLEGLARSIFNPSALWSNLLWRASHLASGPEPPRLFESHRFGQIIPVDEIQDKAWFIFQAKVSSSTMIAGLQTRGSGSNSLRGDYDTILDVSKMAESAKDILDNEKDRIDLVITRFENKDIIWTRNPSKDDEREWNALGFFKYQSPKKGRVAPIKKFTFSGIPEKIIKKIPGLGEITIPEDLEDRVDDTLRQIADYGESALSVKVKVSIDEMMERYLVSLQDQNDNILEKLEFEMTDEVIGFLRTPISKGEYYESEDGDLCSWDIRTDIAYEEIKTANGVVDTSFLYTLVQNNSFLSGRYILPQTAKDVFETHLGDEILMVAAPDLERYRKNWKKCWKVWFIINKAGARLLSISDIFMRIEDVALLFECRQIIDTDTGLRHPTSIAVTKLDDVRLYSEIIYHPRLNIYLYDKGY